MPNRPLHLLLAIGFISILIGVLLVFPLVVWGRAYTQLDDMKQGLATLVKAEEAYRAQHGVYVAGIARTGRPVAGYQPDSSFRILVRANPKGPDFYAAAMSLQTPNQMCAVAVGIPSPPPPTTVNKIPACSPNLGDPGASVLRVFLGEMLSPR